MDRDDRNQGPNRNDRTNKDPTSTAEGAEGREFDIASNMRARGEDPSPRRSRPRRDVEPAAGRGREQQSLRAQQRLEAGGRA